MGDAWGGSWGSSWLLHWTPTAAPVVPTSGGGGRGDIIPFSRKRWRALRKKEEDLEQERARLKRAIQRKEQQKKKLEKQADVAREEIAISEVASGAREARDAQRTLATIARIQLDFRLRIQAIEDQLAMVRQQIAFMIEEDEEEVAFLLLH